MDPEIKRFFINQLFWIRYCMECEFVLIEFSTYSIWMKNSIPWIFPVFGKIGLCKIFYRRISLSSSEPLIKSIFFTIISNKSIQKCTVLNSDNFMRGKIPKIPIINETMSLIDNLNRWLIQEKPHLIYFFIMMKRKRKKTFAIVMFILGNLLFDRK